MGDRILAVDDEPVVGAAIDKVCFHVSEVVVSIYETSASSTLCSGL